MNKFEVSANAKVMQIATRKYLEYFVTKICTRNIRQQFAYLIFFLVALLVFFLIFCGKIRSLFSFSCPLLVNLLQSRELDSMKIDVASTATIFFSARLALCWLRKVFSFIFIFFMPCNVYAGPLCMLCNSRAVRDLRWPNGRQKGRWNADNYICSNRQSLVLQRVNHRAKENRKIFSFFLQQHLQKYQLWHS